MLSRIVAAVVIVAGAAVACSSAAAQEVRYRERVDVERVVIDARVVDGSGRPIQDLGPADFRVRVDGRPVPLESVQWVSGKAPDEAAALASRGYTGVAEVPAGQLIVFFFQKDLDMSRTPGLLLMLQKAQELASTFGPEDRVAVLSFDSHLKLWLDFTSDRAQLRRVLERSVMFRTHPPPLDSGSSLSLAPYFDRVAGQRAATPERALQLVGEALEPLPGAKSLVLFGWGLGRLTGGMVRMERDYGPAIRALNAARATVFSLDVTRADWHSLEVGLQNVAADTGGFYARTHIFPDAALTRLERALEGHYVLSFVRPSRRPGRARRLSIDLMGRRGTVLAQSTYTD